MSELKLYNGNKILVCCFGSMVTKFGLIPPFEFANYLSSEYIDKCDLLFYIDKHQCCYHKGIDGITTNIDETVSYLNNQISGYDKVIFMGNSAGGYAAVLFGSLCNNVDNVVSFRPKIKLCKPLNKDYENLKNVINSTTKYILFGDKSISNTLDHHHISQCEILEDFLNVKIFKENFIILKKMRDDGKIKSILDGIISKNSES